MAGRAAKTNQVKSAGSSPAHMSRLPQLPPSQEKNLTLDDLQRVIQGSHEKLEKKLEEKINKIQDIIDHHNVTIREDIVEAFKGVMSYTLQVEERVNDLEQRNEKIEARIDEQQLKGEEETILRDFKEMEWAIRIRGLKDGRQTSEDLRKIIAEALVPFLGESLAECSWQIDKIYRVNSWIARQKNLPRDIVIYFVTRRMRNLVITSSYRKKFMVGDQEVVIMKEIPLRMLRSRKDYAFLVEELKKRELQYRWEAPAGLTVSYQGKRYRLTSVWHAKDFYTNVLKAGNPPSPVQKKKEVQAKEGEKESPQLQTQGSLESTQASAQQDDLMDTAIGEPSCDIFQPSQTEILQPQIQTRATAKRMEQELKKQQKPQEAVGGARPKSTQQSIESVLQRLAGSGHVK